MEAENKIRTIKAAVQPVGGGLHQMTFLSIPGVIPSIKTAGLRSSFQSEENNSMVSETMENYSLDFSEADYENPGEQTQMVFMASGG